MNNNEDDSGFEEDSQDNIFVNEIRSNNSSSSSDLPESAKELFPCAPLVHSGISLEPDMIFGWRPKSLLTSGPIPFIFNYETIPAKSCVFYGYRPEDSLDLHEDFSGPASYPYSIDPVVKQAFKITKKRSEKKDCRPFTGMKPDTEEPLKFESKFESGNLDKVCKIRENEYDLYIRNDTNTYGKNQWFYFKIFNSGEEQKVKLNIVNFCKQNSLYSQGLQPCVFREDYPEKGWHYMSEDLKYSYSKVNKALVNKRTYYCLSFSIVFPSKEWLWFAYSVPYTYTDLLRYLKTVEKINYVKRSVLCKSLTGLDVPLLTISDSEPVGNKETVLVTARVHPGETHGSWVMQGFLKYITGNSCEAQRLRQIFVFKIVPMLNPDGVVVGNSRCSANGQDLNRQFQHPDHLLHPEIHYLKNLILASKKTLAYLDFHAHSRKKGVFFYGPYFPLHSDNHCRIRVIPKLLSENTEIFRYYSCKFRNDWSKRKAARLVMSKEHSLPFSYTIEASSYGYLAADRSTIVFSSQILEDFGKCLLSIILQYIDLRNEEDLQKEIRAGLRYKKALRLSPIKEEKKLKMSEILEDIKNDLQNEDGSDSGGSNSDSINDLEEEKTNKKILNFLKLVNKAIRNSDDKRHTHSHAPKTSKIRKLDYIDSQAKSTLAKYFSRACTDNKNKFKFRAERVKKPLDQKPKTRAREQISKFSYCRGLYGLRPNPGLEKSVLNRKKTLDLEGKEVSQKVFIENLDKGYSSSSEGEAPEYLKAMKKNSKYQSLDSIP